MKIAQSNVNMYSSHTYYEGNTVAVQSGVMTRDSFLDSLQDQEKRLDSLELSDEVSKDMPLTSENYSSLRPSRTEFLSSYESTLQDQLAEIRATLLERLLSTTATALSRIHITLLLTLVPRQRTATVQMFK